VGRLLKSASVLGQEIFAFDPAGNLLDVSQSKAEPVLDSYEGNPAHTYRHQPRSTLLGNLLRKYASTSYYYDDQGNLTDKCQNGEPHSLCV
jgi:hypothetical protein